MRTVFLRQTRTPNDTAELFVPAVQACKYPKAASEKPNPDFLEYEELG
jgi:hypothetical protein